LPGCHPWIRRCNGIQLLLCPTDFLLHCTQLPQLYIQLSAPQFIHPYFTQWTRHRF